MSFDDETEEEKFERLNSKVSVFDLARALNHQNAVNVSIIKALVASNRESGTKIDLSRAFDQIEFMSLYIDHWLYGKPEPDREDYFKRLKDEKAEAAKGAAAHEVKDE